MPIPTGSLEGVKSGFDPLPAGRYDVEVTDAEETKASQEAKNPGAPMIKIEFTVINDEEYEGRKLWLNLVFTEKSMGPVKGNLLALGYTEEEMADKKFEVNADELVERRAIALVKVGTNPKTKEANNSVKRLAPVGEGESELPG